MGCAGALVVVRKGGVREENIMPQLPTEHAGGWGLHVYWRGRGCGIIMGRRGRRRCVARGRYGS